MSDQIKQPQQRRYLFAGGSMHNQWAWYAEGPDWVETFALTTDELRQETYKPTLAGGVHVMRLHSAEAISLIANRE